MAISSREALITQHFAALRSMDQESWVATFAPDGVRFDPGEGRATTGHEALRRFFAGLTAAFDALEIQEERAYTNGSRAAVRWVCRARGRSGTDVTFEGIDVFEIDEEDGRIATLWAYWDAEALLAQLQGDARER